jgi:hypothetical protein
MNPEDIKKPEEIKMTPWYNPCQLFDTAGKTILSTVVGKFADPRTGLTDTPPTRIFDYSKHLTENENDFIGDEARVREEIWLDYVADVGDGWNPTYAVACALAQQQLRVDNLDQPLPRGEILFFGGDGVYPTANTDAYEDRLVTPYRLAFKAGTSPRESAPESELSEEPHVFALPGNHDWYDSLVAFRQLFCSRVFNLRRFANDPKTQSGGWRTRQKLSYFTLKLPQRWWLLGVDLQLTHNIDVGQLEYFAAIAQQMERGDKVILCVPEPFWVKSIKYQNVTTKFEEKEKSIETLERFFSDRGVEIKLYLAGDLHHYRRFERDGVHKITAGGGGAFLHPTHDFDFKKNERDKDYAEQYKGFSLKGEYPEFERSRSMDSKNFWFLLNNKSFGIFTAVIYFILAFLIHGRIDGEFSFSNVLSATGNRLIDAPVAVFVILLFFVGLIFFTDSNSKLYKWLAAISHGVAHLVAAFALGWGGYWISLQLLDGGDRSPWFNLVWFVSVLVVTAVGGYVIGSIIMGLYLYISLHIFGRHDNEAFSAMKIQDFKNFLRLHIDRAGALHIYPIKIEEVPRHWRANDGANPDDPDFYVPDGSFDKKLSTPTLIEDQPITVM